MNTLKLSELFLRYSLATCFLSAVADRFGVWGAAGTTGVVWGNFNNFNDYTASLLFYFPSKIIPLFSWSATILEILIALLLILGIKLRLTAFFSALLLLSFIISMTIAFGIKSSFDYSVFTACAASLFLALSSKN